MAVQGADVFFHQSFVFGRGSLRSSPGLSSRLYRGGHPSPYPSLPIRCLDLGAYVASVLSPSKKNSQLHLGTLYVKLARDEEHF